ncbi:autotransporter outer membrane beta-barrel domain-containing protein, partial [Motiliproteus sp. MSK22-1]|uniref:autotransporter outer membrane beta-barrel domain-containing protein n=1 Tax=Motiliproteus sp. MSK22-1 TaxID=1897630 RepID=UPI00117D2871
EASLVLQQITVDDAGAAVEVSESGVTNQQRNLVSRLNALRGGARGLDLSGLNFNIDGKSLSSAHLPSHWVKPETERGGSAGDEESSLFSDKVGIFIGGTISLGDKDKTDNEDGFEFETQGLTLGVDYRMTEQTILGAALGYTQIDTDIDNNGGSLDTDG